jgi:hypothetical protein
MIRRTRRYRVHILISRIRSSLLCAVAALYPLWASAAQTFVYVAAPVCPHDPCASDVLVYDAATAGLVTRISLGAARPSYLALSPDGRRLYVSTETDPAGELIVIDTTQHRIVERYPGVAGGQVTAVSRDGSRLFIGSGSFISLYDTVARAFVWSTQGDGQISTADSRKVLWRPSRADESMCATSTASPSGFSAPMASSIWWRSCPCRHSGRLFRLRQQQRRRGVLRLGHQHAVERTAYDRLDRA